MLCTLGDLVEDVVVWLDAPIRRAADTPARVFRRRGGSAANVAAFVGSIGQPVRLIGQVGADELGRALTAELEADGVEVYVEREGRTGTIVVLVEPDGERTMLPDRGAATELSHIPEAWLHGVTWLHLPAYSLSAEPLATTACGAARMVRARGGRLSIDASSMTVIDALGVHRFRAVLAALAPAVLFANAQEAEALGVEQVWPGGVDLVVEKRGADPVLLRRAGGSVVPCPVPAVDPGTARDTTGAGDAFAAAFLAATLSGVGPEEAAAAGALHALGTLAHPGATR